MSTNVYFDSKDEYDDDVYSESDDGEDIYVEGNGVENDNNNNNGVGGGYYTSTAPPNLNGGPRDRQQPPPRQRSPSASFFAQPGTLAGEKRGGNLDLCPVFAVLISDIHHLSNVLEKLWDMPNVAPRTR